MVSNLNSAENSFSGGRHCCKGQVGLGPLTVKTHCMKMNHMIVNFLCRGYDTLVSTRKNTFIFLSFFFLLLFSLNRNSTDANCSKNWCTNLENYRKKKLWNSRKSLLLTSPSTHSPKSVSVPEQTRSSLRSKQLLSIHWILEKQTWITIVIATQW